MTQESVGAIDFDRITDWEIRLESALNRYLPNSLRECLRRESPEFIEDSVKILFKLAGKDNVIDATIDWLRQNSLLAYHGTRLTDAEVDSVREVGLRPLDSAARHTRLYRALSVHPDWDKVAQSLDGAIERFRKGQKAGRRENQVHLTLSRSGLLNGFNHYIIHGSEFDQRVACDLLGKEGIKLLAQDGLSRIIHVSLPGNAALEAAHPYFSIDDLRERGDLPNLIDKFLMSWSYRLAHPGFEAASLEVDSGMVFRDTVPAAWISNIETLN